MKVVLKAIFPKHKRGWKEGDPEIFEIPEGATIIGGCLEGYGSVASFLLYTEKIST